MNKRPLSSRELWLVSLLPAALVLIVLTVIKPGTSEISRLHSLLADAAEHDKMRAEVRDLSLTLREHRDEAVRLDGEMIRVRSQVKGLERQSAPRGGSGTGSMAQRFEFLVDRLDRSGVSVLSCEALGGSAGTSGQAAASWRLAVAGGWPQMARSLGDEQLTSPGIRIESLEMKPARPGVALHEWVMVVSADAVSEEVLP